MRKYSMNEEFRVQKTDLMNSPIKEPIKEHIFEDDEEEIKEINLIKHNKYNAKPFGDFKENRIFRFDEEGDEMNLDQPAEVDFNMGIEPDLDHQFHSFNLIGEKQSSPQRDHEMSKEDGSLFSMEVDGDNYHPFQSHFN